MRISTIAFPIAIAATTALIALDGFSRPHAPMGAEVDVGSVVKPALTVIDGDTVTLGARTLRLAGIDAPEIGQVCDETGHLTTCGLDSAYALRKILAMERGTVSCVESPTASGDAECRVGMLDIAENLLSQGMAVALPSAPPRYKDAEARARSVPLGIWKSTFVAPAEWRQGKRLDSEAEAVKAAVRHTELPWRVSGVQVLPEPITHRDPCIVKGAVKAGNVRVFYVPLDSDYDSVDVDRASGGRMFCSDDEARSAGWQHVADAKLR